MPSEYGTFKEYLADKYKGPFMATDIIIRYNDGAKDGIVLIERKYPPLGLALPGGIAERMQFQENAIKEAKEETGLDVILDNPNQPLCVLSRPDQDPRAFLATAVYTAQGYGTLKPREEEDAKWAGVFTLDEIARILPQEQRWAFPIHHRKALEIYLQSVGYVRG
jgi:8-oxo-dGTP diphosphatase